MSVMVAVKTIQAMHEAVTRDQGATYRQNLQRVLPHIGDAYRGEDEGFRTHLGASLIGRPCGRSIWYSFRWAVKAHFEGRMLRLFNRGHLEEARFIALLLAMGVQVYQQDEHGRQYRISYFGGHFGGSGDGVVIGVPDVQQGQPLLGEFKTHNDKSFSKLAGKNWREYEEGVLGLGPKVAFTGEGVRSAKFEHWIQCQSYMRKMGLAAALYLAVNKDNDHIYAEIVPLDSSIADDMVQRARTIIIADAAPAMINKSPGWHDCKYCDHYGVCKKGEQPERNCRTCQWSKPQIDGPFAGKWTCENKERQLNLLFPASNPKNEDFSLTKERQLEGCEFYLKNATM